MELAQENPPSLKGRGGDSGAGVVHFGVLGGGGQTLKKGSLLPVGTG